MTEIPDTLEKADAETLREILRNAESYLAAQLTVILASNQRAMSFASLLMGALIVVAGSSASLLLKADPDRSLSWIGLGVAGGLLLAMCLALYAARPTGFEFSGNSPEEWLHDVRDAKPLSRSLAEQAGHYASMIVSNKEAITRDGRHLTRSGWIVCLTLAIGAIAIAIYSLPIRCSGS